MKKVSSRIEHSEGGSTTYQGAELTKHEEGVAYLKSHKDQYTTSIQACLKDHVKAQNTDLLTYALTILAPKRWEKTEDASFGYEALDSFSTRFKVPFEVDCSVLQEEWDDMVDYVRRYLNLVQEEYQVVWWKLCCSSVSPSPMVV